VPSGPKKMRPPPRVRYEPPTLEEAVSAARDLSEDPNGVVEIAAGLMGVPEEQVREHLRKEAPRRTLAPVIQAGRRTVIVETRTRARAGMR
jgi:2-phospho-L-lactate guanylyltransferase (CobY/MobA/RfbA family)